jgi:CMP-N,N'-diacetyllegionaminic acid synthase
MRKAKKNYTKIAIIPARGGSRRLEDKNTYPLGGKPLICYTVESVIDSKCFDTIIVSTDSEKIKNAVSHYEVTLHHRESKYATSRMTVLEALLAMMADIPNHDIFAYFLPTCPFRNSKDIRQGLGLLTEDIDSVVSIVEYSEPIQLAMIEKQDHVIPIFDNLTAGLTNSRFIQKYYRPNGGFYISWWDKLVMNRNFFIGNVKGYKMPKIRSVDINDISDIITGETILRRLQHGEIE